MNKSLSDNTIYITAISLSILISLLSINNSLINNDGILYLNTAKIFNEQGLHIALKSYHWPLFPITIGLIAQSFNCSILTAAYFICTLLQCIIVLSYIKLFKIVSDSKINLLFALVTILGFIQFNDYRHYIIRDWGYWTFSLMAIINLYHLYFTPETNKIYKLTLYYINCFIAFLFRGEALVLLATLPIGLLFINDTKSNIISQLKKTYMPLAISLVIGFIVFLFIILFNKNYLGLDELLYSLYVNLHFNKLAIIQQTYSNNINILTNQIFELTNLSKTSAILYLLVGNIVIYITEYFSVLNPINIFMLLVFYKLYKDGSLSNTNINSNIFKFTIVSVFILSLIPLAFVQLIFVTSGRYFLLSTLLLLLFVPFSLSYIWDKLTAHPVCKNKPIIINSICSVVFISICLMKVNIFDNSKNYIKLAGNWFQQQNFDTNQAASNNIQLSYYAGTENHFIQLNDKTNLDINSNQIRYLLLKIKHKQTDITDHINDLSLNNKLSVLNNFRNKRGDQVVIIDLKPS